MSEQLSSSRHHPLIFTLCLSLLTLAGCGGGGGGGDTPTPTPTTPGITLARFAYVANYADDTVSIFFSNNTTGQLSHRGYVQTGGGPGKVLVHPNGQFAYTANYTGQTVSLFAVDWTDGDLVPAPCNGVATDCATGGNPTDLVFDSVGLRAYVANEATDSISVFNVNRSTGALGTSWVQNLPSGATDPSAIHLDPNGNFLYVTHRNSDIIGIFAINSADGTLVASGTAASAETVVSDIAIANSGQHAYIANQTTGAVESFDIDAGGQLTSTGSVASGGTAQNLAIDPTDSWLYVTNADPSGTLSVFAIQGDGTLSAMNCSGATAHCATGGNPEAIRIDPTGQFIAVTNRDDDTLDIFAIDTASGELTRRHTTVTRDLPRDLAYLTDSSEVQITPRFAYVTNENSDDVSVMSVNNSTGALSAVGTPVAAGNAPNGVTADPGGRFLYVANSMSRDISAYTINSGTGAITELPGSPYSTNTISTRSVIVDPSARFLYATHNAKLGYISVFAIDATSGSLTQITGSPFTAGTNPDGIAIDPSGRFAYAVNSGSDNISCYTIDPASGALSEFAGSPIAGGNAPTSVKIDPSGRYLYTANAAITGGKYLVSGYRIDTNNGTLTELTGSPYDTVTGYGPISIDVDPLGEFVYVANLTANNVKLFTINADTGELTGGGTVTTGTDPQSVHIDPTGRFVYTANGFSHDISGFSINAANGALTEISASPTTTGGSGPFSITTVAAFQ